MQNQAQDREKNAFFHLIITGVLIVGAYGTQLFRDNLGAQLKSTKKEFTSKMKEIGGSVETNVPFYVRTAKQIYLNARKHKKYFIPGVNLNVNPIIICLQF